MSIRKKILLGVFLLSFVGGCGSYVTFAERLGKTKDMTWDAWKRKVVTESDSMISVQRRHDWYVGDPNNPNGARLILVHDPGETGISSLFKDPHEKETFLESGCWYGTGMSVTELEVSLLPCSNQMRPPWLEKEYSSKGGYETYKATFRIEQVPETGFKNRKCHTFWFKDDKLYDWSSYYYSSYSY